MRRASAGVARVVKREVRAGGRGSQIEGGDESPTWWFADVEERLWTQYTNHAGIYTLGTDLQD